MPKTPRAKPSPITTFESDLTALKKIVATLEDDNQSLAETLAQFKSGMALIEQCQRTLAQAQQDVTQLCEKQSLNPLTRMTQRTIP